jgi:hypothetical protein
LCDVINYQLIVDNFQFINTSRGTGPDGIMFITAQVVNEIVSQPFFSGKVMKQC